MLGCLEGVHHRGIKIVFVVFWFITNECLLQGRSIYRSVGSAFGFDDLPPPPPPRVRVDEYPGDASVDMCFDCASPDARPRGGALGIRIRKLLLMCECVCMCVCVSAHVDVNVCGAIFYLNL